MGYTGGVYTIGYRSLPSMTMCSWSCIGHAALRASRRLCYNSWMRGVPCPGFSLNYRNFHSLYILIHFAYEGT